MRKKLNDRLFLVFFVLLFLLAVGIIQYFIWSDLFVQEFDSDVAENVLWAQASIESGKLIDPDYIYTQMQPFGGNIVFIPVVKAFGVGVFSLRLGMCICSSLFAVVLAVFFLSLGWKASVGFFSSGIILLILCGTKKLRDIFWSHVVHYNLSLFYLLLTFIFLPLVFSHERKKHLTGLIGFELCLILGSANNIAVMMFFSLSLFCALALESFLMGGIRNFFKKNVLLLLGETLFGCAVGFVLGKILTMNGSTGYSELFSAFSPADKWAANMEPFLKYWVGMFAILPEQNVPFFSAVGIKLLIRIGAALAVMAVTIRSFFSFRSISSRAERVFICVHWMICVEILFFFVFGVISKNNWRIIPMFFTALVTACIFLKNDAERYAECLPGIQLLDIGTAVLMLLHAGICGLSVLNQSIDTSFWFGQGTVLKTLADHSLTYGYNLDYWFSNSITVLTDEEIRVREVYLRDGKLIPSELQVNTRWYKDQPDTDRYFLICQEEEFWNHPEFADGAVDIYRVNQERTFRSGPVGFFIFVYEKNIF